MGVDKIEDMERWYAVQADKTYTEFYSPRSAFTCKFWVKKIDTGLRHTTSYDNTYIIYEYEVYDNEIKQFFPEREGWQVVRMQDYIYKNAYNHHVNLEICDPVGELRSIRTSVFEEKGVIEAISILKKLAVHKKWKGYEIQMEKEHLEEIKASLAKKIRIFESTPFFQKVLKDLKAIETEQEPSSTVIERKLARLSKAGLTLEFLMEWLNEDDDLNG